MQEQGLVQAFCRVADALSLPSMKELQQYYGGKHRMPDNPWADYWLANMASSTGHSRKNVPFLRGEGDFRKGMDASEEWISRALVRRYPLCPVRQLSCTVAVF